MYEYSFCRVETDFGGLSGPILKEHREIIQQKASEGWRYVDAIPVRQWSGRIENFDLVFEREKQ